MGDRTSSTHVTLFCLVNLLYFDCLPQGGKRVMASVGVGLDLLLNRRLGFKTDNFFVVSKTADLLYNVTILPTTFCHN